MRMSLLLVVAQNYFYYLETAGGSCSFMNEYWLSIFYGLYFFLCDNSRPSTDADKSLSPREGRPLVPYYPLKELFCTLLSSYE